MAKIGQFEHRGYVVEGHSEIIPVRSGSESEYVPMKRQYVLIDSKDVTNELTEIAHLGEWKTSAKELIDTKYPSKPLSDESESKQSAPELS